ncbi:bifunctional (p)ppGpp synthetase/guanosine-3',5'-bis(diphosphate) 3'-pyrophosphohydrolase [Gammaproteobacteria bacterium]|nr:bifunctional (p)ppGpp synthetase/guanosine-3',5'-bis(diphosphate) 3'-pyrophosphohydrolase [Gammaproteobacteria bacterium]
MQQKVDELYEPLRSKIGYLSEQSKQKVSEAFLYADQAHKGQLRFTGEPYVTHPVAVACLVAGLKLDAQTVIASLLHDTLEDTDATCEDLSHRFDNEVASLVEGVTKLSQVEFKTRIDKQAENFRKMLLAMSKDIRVVLIKLADRTHNISTLSTLPLEKKKRIAAETLDIYAPIAKRLGMYQVSHVLDEQAFKIYYPFRHRVISKAMASSYGLHQNMLNEITTVIKQVMDKKGLVYYSIKHRRKQYYSVYQKMKNKHLSFSEVMDVHALRIIVQDPAECYTTLGILHQTFKPFPNRFKDYIALPKSNGYQSLHTVLFGPNSIPIEIQIRSKQMDRIANNGLAAHWLYKESNENQDLVALPKLDWVNRLIEIEDCSKDSASFLEYVKVDLFPENIYVFTPKGKIIELPVGAGILDFAYAIHTDVGHQCVAAKIDRQLTPINTVLTNGVTVEIITASKICTKESWLSIVVTGRARSAILQSLNVVKREELVRLGQQLVSKACKEISLVFDRQMEAKVSILSETESWATLEDFYYQVGSGMKGVKELLQKVVNSSGQVIVSSENKSVAIGQPGLAVTYSLCCLPIPGDTIVGFMREKKGLIIHDTRCSMSLKEHRKQSESVAVKWSEQLTGSFVSRILIFVLNKPGVLADLAFSVSDSDSNIEDIELKNNIGDYAEVVFWLRVKNLNHLYQIISHLKRFVVVQSVRRWYPDGVILKKV